MKKLCKNCRSPDLVQGRRICKACNNKRAKKYYLKRGKQLRAQKTHICDICSKEFTQWRKTQNLCPGCVKDSKNTGFKQNNYLYTTRGKLVHRELATQILGRQLSNNEIVHHVDEDTKNNNPNNLWVMSRHMHGKLHEFLRIQRVAYEKSLGKNSVNCWNILRVSQTTAWLEMTGANVIKLGELDDQQPRA